MPEKELRAPSAPRSADLKTDISQILNDVKLPERASREAIGSSAGKEKGYEVKQFDTILGAQPAATSEPAPATPKPANATPAAQTSAPQEESMPRTTVMPTQAASPAPAPQQKEGDDVLTPVRTLKDDLQHVVRDQKISLVSAVSLEEARRHRPGAGEAAKLPQERQKPRRLFFMLFSAIVLVVLGAAALFGVSLSQSARTAAPEASSPSLIFAEATSDFDISNQAPLTLKQLLAQLRTSSIASLGSITRIVPTISVGPADATPPRPATFTEFMHAIGANPPDELLRALSSDFFFGIHTVDKNAPVLIVPVASYQRAFAGMLAWEGSMNAELSPIFASVPPQKQDASGILVTRTFEDDIMRNYDVRELKDDAGNVQMYYSFPTQNALIIAESPYSFTEVLSRLQAQRGL